MEKYARFLDWKNQYYENDNTTQCNLQIQWNLYQITNGMLHSSKTKDFIICMEMETTLNSQCNLEEEKQSWRNKPSWVQTILQNYSHQDNTGRNTEI